MNHFEDLLHEGDLRSIGKSNEVVSLIGSQADFDELFALLLHADRRIVMRAADAVEKVTRKVGDYLHTHKHELVELCKEAKDKELKWHLAALISRLQLTRKEMKDVWQVLTTWLNNKQESRIVRVNAIQALFDLLPQHPSGKQELDLMLREIEKEQVPSVTARIRKLRDTSGFL